MECQKVCTGIYKRLHITDRAIDHQMNIDETISIFAQGFQHGDSNGNVRDEFPVHYVKMDIICTALQAFIHFSAEF